DTFSPRLVPRTCDYRRPRRDRHHRGALHGRAFHSVRGPGRCRHLLLILFNLFNLQKPSLYMAAGLFTWICVLESGVHATRAGVAVGSALPLAGGDDSLVVRTERALKPWVAYATVPIFAFANAGVPFSGVSFATLAAPVPLGILRGFSWQA